MGRKPYTVEDLKHMAKRKIPYDQLQFIITSDLGHTDIANMFGVSRQRIHQIREKNGVKGFHRNGTGKA